jgi:CBS domain-containing protein
VNAQEIMTRNVITVRGDSPLPDAIALMLDHGISGLPVVNQHGDLLGMLTEGDLLRRAELGTERHRPRWLEFLRGPGALAQEYTHAHGRTVSEVMSPKPVVVDPDASLERVVDLMERHRIKRVPVLRQGRLVGIVSRANLLRALAVTVKALPPASPSDGAIREQLWQELSRSEWAPRSLLNIVVREGTVHLYGTILDGREREALRVVAENIPGVRQVRDHLVWCEPISGMVVELPEEDEQARRTQDKEA